MDKERREYPRIRLNIYAKGVIRVDTDFFQYTATAVNMSQAGVAIKFSEDTTRRAKEAIKKGFIFKNAEVMLQLISYVEDNIPATGVVARITKAGNAILLGVKLNPLDKKSAATLAKILEISPFLKEPGAKKTALTRFASFDEFISELTALTILTEKKTSFLIGKEKFSFTGMHRDDKGDLHVDCIESVDRPGLIYCPDCRAKIHQDLLI